MTHPEATGPATGPGPRRRGFFVTGTGTDVGKTVAAAAAVSVLRAAGVDAVPMKPVQTGCGGAAPRRSPDLERVLRLCGLEPDGAQRALMAPCLLRDPCSPHLAAAREGAPVDPAAVARAFDALARGHAAVVAEGAGGALVPLDDRACMLDLAARFGLPLLVVARSGLGTINHTLLTLAAARARGLPLAGVVLNDDRPGERGYIEEDNRATIERLGRVPVLGWLPWLPALAGDGCGPAAFAAFAAAHLDAARLLEALDP